jgi:hypothetical protein
VKQANDEKDEGLKFIYLLTMRTMVAITDCLNMSTIMYLFYFQGMKDTLGSKGLQKD